MKFLADKVNVSGSEYRVIADAESPEVEIWGKDFAWEFMDRHAAYSFLGKAYKTANDMRNIPPGQEVVLTMANGEQKTMNVLTNDAQQVTIVDNAGRQFSFPHLQPGSTPRILPKKNVENPAQSGDEGGPEPQDEGGGDASMMEPGTGTVMSRRRAYYEDHRCSDCGGDLCESCGVCHNCSDKKSHRAALSKKAIGTLYFCPKCNTSRTVLRDRDGQEIHRYMNGDVVRFLSCKHPVSVNEESTKPGWLPKEPRWEPKSASESDYARRPNNCKHDGGYLHRKNPSDPERACSQCGMVYEASGVDSDLVKPWPKAKPQVEGPKPKRPDLSKHLVEKEHYRSQQFAPAEKGKNVNVFALSKKAQPMPSGPPGQANPPGSPPMSSQQTSPVQAPAGDQPQPQAGSGPGRPLSRHEIVTEAEILIRNALYKGVKIGTWDLVEYMRQQYSNPPEELYEGATKAWEKVQWEEQEAFEVAKGPGPQQQKNPGVEQEEAPNPSVQEIAERPETGPTQVKV